LDRLDKLNQFAADNSGDPNSLDTQLDFLMAEGESLGSDQDKAAWQEFMSATTPEAANAALKKYIRYGDESEGTRLEYAENLLTGGGVEVRGERGLLTEATGERMPTPRGEVRRRVASQMLVQDGIAAAKAGAIHAVAQSGLGGPAPAITETGRDARIRGFVSGQGAASPQELANAQQAVQSSLPKGVKPSQAEMNLLTLAFSYKWALNMEKSPEKAQAIAGEIYQAYKKKATQFSSMAKVTAQNGDVDKAAQIMARAYAFIPDGQEASFTKDQDGNYLVEVTDLATGKSNMQQVLTPDEMFGHIMNWHPAEFDNAIRRAAGMAAGPSAAMQQQSAAIAGAIPEGPPGTPPGTQPLTQQAEVMGYSPVGGPAIPVPDIAGLTEKERDPALAATKFAAENREATRKAAFGEPFNAAAREAVDLEIEAAAENLPDRMEALQALFADRPERIGGILHAIQQMNPNVDMQTIISDLGIMAEGRNNFSVVGQTNETRSTQVPDSVVLNMPTHTFTSIWNALAKKEGAAPTAPDTTARDAATAAERAAAEQAPPPPVIHPRGGIVRPTGRSRSGQPMYGP